MPQNSPVLSLPYIQPSQAQKHVTHNEALRLLDAIVQLTVLSRSHSEPPALPSEGDRYLVASGASSTWAGQAQSIALWIDNGWQFHAPKPGWQAFVSDENKTVTFIDGIWIGSEARALQVERLGIGTNADLTNGLSVAAAASLFTHTGNDHRMVLNKSSTADTASLLLQSGYSGRAEIGLAGDDSLSIKLSADGSSWQDMLRLDAMDGSITINGQLTGNAVQATSRDATPGRLMTVGAFGVGEVTAPETVALANAVVSGFASYDSTDPDAPNGSEGAVLIMRASASAVMQIAFSAGQSLFWMRNSMDNGTNWSAWITPTGGT